MATLWQQAFPQRRIEVAMADLPDTPDRITDVYFLRSREIIQKDGLNPWAQYQVFIRKTGTTNTLAGIYDAIATILRFSPQFFENGGRIWALPEGSEYESCETVLLLEGWLQDIIHLETVYLGCISHGVTKWNEGVSEVDLGFVERRVREICRATRLDNAHRPVTYFGARHYHWRADSVIAQAAFRGGAQDAATDVGAMTLGERAVGTIPHALECVYHWRYGRDQAVRQAIGAFHRHIDPRVARMSLIDYDNHEIRDGLDSFHATGGKLFGVRVDTNGAVVAEGGAESANSKVADLLRAEGLYLPEANDPISKYWYGTGVTVTGVLALRRAMPDSVKISLTSGFANPIKVAAFTQAEKLLGMRLYDSLGVGEVFPGRFATSDIFALGEDENSLIPIHKVGRPVRPSTRLVPALGDFSGVDISKGPRWTGAVAA